MTTTIDGSAGITFPSGTNAQAAPSKVLQVVQGTTSTQTSTASTSYVASNLTATITPLFTTSKILILVSSVGTNTSGATSNYTIYRNSTNLGGGSNSALSQYNPSTAYFVWVPVIISYLDNPATTSATTYTLYLSAGSGSNAYIAISQVTSTITLMEIAQ
jgi:hypothetical protein